MTLFFEIMRQRRAASQPAVLKRPAINRPAKVWLTAMAVVILAAGPLLREAGAFEQKGGGTVAADPSPIPGIEIVPHGSSRGAGLELTVPNTLDLNASPGKLGGTSLPGWGLLPKLDFGLELLYGAPSQGTPNTDQLDALPDAVTVHGELKKQF